MTKPTPPDQERVELIISGDDPESYRATKETARILAAPQIAKTIQKKIDECREKIRSVMTLIVKCQSFVKQAGYYSNNGMNGPNGLYGALQINSAGMKEVVSVAPDDDATRFVDLAARINAARNHLSNAICHKQKIDPQNGLELITKCHAEIAELLSVYLPQLQERLKKHEDQLDDLFALVQGK